MKLKELRRLQRQFAEAVREAKRIRDTRRFRDSDDEYAVVLNSLERIVALRQDAAEQEGLGDIPCENWVDHAESVVEGVREGFVRKPKLQRISASRIVGTCYPGESAHYYEGFTPKEALDVELEFKAYEIRGFRIPAIWVFPRNVDGKEVYYVIDGHGRSGLANCIGKPTYVRIFR